MSPFYFGSGSRRLFGIYEPSRVARSRPRAALLCYPWGSEYLHAHRSMRQLSSLLADAGVDSLRFDFYGTGDSAGDAVEGDLEGWRQDILAAAEELSSIAGVNRTTLVGLRLGATLAAQAAVDLAGRVDGLALWDPIVEGRAYIHDLYAACRAMPIAIKEPVARRASLGGGYEILGFPLTERMHRELETLSLAAIAPAIPCPVHAVASGTAADAQLIRNALASVPSLTFQRIESLPAWAEDWPTNSGAVPVKILQQIVEWLT